MRSLLAGWPPGSDAGLLHRRSGRPATSLPSRVSAPAAPRHASHALDRGALTSLIQTTLGRANVAMIGLYLHAGPNDGSAHYLAG